MSDWRLALVLITAITLPTVSGAGSSHDELVAEVRAAEVGFAKSMADRDHAAFAAWVADEAVFMSGDTALTGKAAVVDGWKRLFDKPEAPFAWAPEQVEVLASGALAFSSGPIFNPRGERVGTYNSVWRREADGSWRVVFDRGCP